MLLKGRGSTRRLLKIFTIIVCEFPKAQQRQSLGQSQNLCADVFAERRHAAMPVIDVLSWLGFALNALAYICEDIANQQKLYLSHQESANKPQRRQYYCRCTLFPLPYFESLRHRSLEGNYPQRLLITKVSAPLGTLDILCFSEHVSNISYLVGCESVFSASEFSILHNHHSFEMDHLVISSAMSSRSEMCKCPFRSLPPRLRYAG